MSSTERLFTSVSAEQHQRFYALAKVRGMSGSKLLSLIVDAVLMQNTEALAAREYLSEREVGRDDPPRKYTIRLKASDAVALETRAQARSMKPSSYLTHLTRSHLIADPPLPSQELAQVKRLVGELNGIRMALLRIVELSGQGASISEPIGHAIQALLPGLKRIRNDVQAQLAANAKSWEGI